jgi:tetratricopeptide (TPR) repeat protein
MSPSGLLACACLVVAAGSPSVDGLLAEASARLDAGDPAAALPLIRRYLDARPEAVLVRAHLAELHFRLGEWDDAEAQFGRFVADAQQAAGPARKHLLHAHTRLMEVARERGDAGSEHLHRGAGLYLLATGAGAEEGTEAILCQAASELQKARAEGGDPARSDWYLYLVWSRLGLRQPAEHGLRRALAADRSGLTPAERQGLALAARGLPSGR